MEHVNCTMTQMLRQCVRPDQKDWVLCLPAVELAMNMAGFRDHWLLTLLSELRADAALFDLVR